jgi:aldose 1-epimerase
MAIAEEEFGRLVQGMVVSRFELVADGLTVGLIPFGAIITDVSIRTKDGHPVNIALGLPTLADYVERNKPCFGAVVGRFAGRIGGATFTLDGTEYRLSANDGTNCLHGGTSGFGRRLWSVVSVGEREVALRYVSPDGEEGFPGELTTDLVVGVEPGALRLDYRATCDRPTVLNLANHTYWNLAGDDSGTIDDHLLTVVADRVVPCNAERIPTGEPVPVAGTPLDFRAETRLGDRAVSTERAVADAGGIDHTFVLADAPLAQPEHVATLVEPAHGRRLEVWTTEPALQVYTGNDLDGSLRGPSGVPYDPRAGVALETQHAPDSPNQPSYPSTVLRPGDVFTSTTIYRLSW